MVQKLIESFSSWEGAEGVVLRPIQLAERTMIESNGKSFEVTGAYEVPIWRIDEKNLNGRIYPMSVAKKVVRENRVTIALKNHPEDGKDGSVDDIVAVGKNPHIREDAKSGKPILWADCYFVDKPFQEKVEAVRKHGTGIGLSSCALGELDASGSVLEESFTLERYFDFVVSPSYSVFIDENASPIAPNKQRESAYVAGSHTNSILHEKATGERKSMATLEEKNYSYGVRALKAAAEGLSDPFEKRAAWQDIALYAEGLDFARDDQVLAEQKIAEANTEIEALAKAGQTVDSLEKEKEAIVEKTEATAEELKALQESLTTVSAEYEVALDLIENLSSRDAKLKELYRLTLAERNGRLSGKSVKGILQRVKFLERRIARMKDAYKKLLKNNLMLESKAMQYLKEKQKAELDLYKLKMSENYTTTIVTEEQPDITVIEKKPEDASLPVKVDADETFDDAAAYREYPEEDYDGDISGISDPDELLTHHIDFDDDFRETEQIEDYYRDVVRANPAAKKIKEKLLACKTLREAERMYVNLIEFADYTPSASRKSILRESKPSFRQSTPPADAWYRRRKDWV